MLDATKITLIFYLTLTLQREEEQYCLRHSTSSQNINTQSSPKKSPGLFDQRNTLMRNHRTSSSICISGSSCEDGSLYLLSRSKGEDLFARARGVGEIESTFTTIYSPSSILKSHLIEHDKQLDGDSDFTVMQSSDKKLVTLHERKRATLNSSYGSLDRLVRIPYMYRSQLYSPESHLHNYNNRDVTAKNFNSVVNERSDGGSGHRGTVAQNAGRCLPVSLRGAREATSISLLATTTPATSLVGVSQQKTPNKYYGVTGSGCTRRPDESFV